jgi:hypothetical protein
MVYNTRNKVEEQMNSTSYQALYGHLFWKNLYTYKKLRNKIDPCMDGIIFKFWGQ